MDEYIHFITDYTVQSAIVYRNFMLFETLCSEREFIDF